MTGDFSRAVLDAVNYGRDADSIATMAGAICGGIGGAGVVPTEWLTIVERNSKVDVTSAGRPARRDHRRAFLPTTWPAPAPALLRLRQWWARRHEAHLDPA